MEGVRDPVDIEALSSPTRTRMALVALWVFVVLAVLAGLWAYKLTAGADGELRERWPEGSSLAARKDMPTLVMFAHPRCPCTRASLSELRTVLSRFAGRVDASVVFMRPAGGSADWSQTDTWATARSMAGVRVLTDTDGREARLFGATTSGHTVLYDAQGRLLFSGGVTTARGHEGAGPQLDHLARLLQRETAAVAAAAAVAPAAAAPAAARPTPSPLQRPGPVYGCPLREEQP